MGLNQPCHHYQIVQEVLCQQWFRWYGRWCIVGWTVWQIWHWRRRQWHVWWHTNRYNRCSVKRVMMINFLVLNQYCWFYCILCAGSTPGGFISSKRRCDLYESIYSNTGFPHILENLENNKFIFQVLEFYKIRKCPGKKHSLWKNPLQTKNPVHIYYACRRKLVL